MRRRDHVRPRGVHLRVDGKSRSIYRIISFDYIAAMIHQNQIGRANLAEVHAERIHPEMVELLRIARRDVPGNSFIESETRKEPKCGGQHPLAMQPFLCGGGKNWRPRDVQYVCRCSWHLALPCAAASRSATAKAFASVGVARVIIYNGRRNSWCHL